MPFCSMDGLVVGDAEIVGIRYYKGHLNSCPPLRVYYPAKATNSGKEKTSVGWFHEHGLGYFLSGFLHVAGTKSNTWLHRFLSPLLRVFSLVFYSTSSIQGVFLEPTPCPIAQNDNNSKDDKIKKKKYPVIIFSHGLRGTGQENSILMAAWAKRGFVVVSVHHTDGSSSCVRFSDNSDLYYDHGPSLSNYDPNFRPNQIQQRTRDMKQALDFFRTSDDHGFSEIRNICCDNDRPAIAAGFSYGAATASLAAYDYPQDFETLVLLDGWFYLDVSKSAGIEFEFPQQLFNVDGGGLNKNAIFINSEQFAKDIPKLYKATEKLAKTAINTNNDNNNMHVLSGTTHNNFCDVVFWLPWLLLQKIDVIGATNPKSAYQDMIRLSCDFMTESYDKSQR